MALIDGLRDVLQAHRERSAEVATRRPRDASVSSEYSKRSTVCCPGCVGSLATPDVSQQTAESAANSPMRR